MKTNFKKYTENINLTEDSIKDIIGTVKQKDLSLPYGITKRFEEKVSNYLDVKFVLAHCNATSAMYSAMYSAGVGKDTEVICPTYTFWASIAPAINLGAKVVFCDVNPQDFLMNIEDMEQYITNKTKAIIIPHLWGRPVDVSLIKKMCKKFNQKIYLIEDASHSFGGRLNNKYLGTIGDIGIYSLQAGKPLAGGEGGLLVTNNVNVYESSIFLGHYERIRNLESKHYSDYKKTGGGYKFRIHPLASALALNQLKGLEKRLKKQNKIMAYFEKCLSEIESIKVLSKEDYGNFEIGGRFGFKILISDIREKENFIKECNKSGLCIENEYIPLLHLEKFFVDHKARNCGLDIFENTCNFHKKIISLPVFYTGDCSMIDLYISKFKVILSKYLSN